MNFGRISRGDCINVPPPADPRCNDPAFALANPGICPAHARLVIKPGNALTCVLGPIQFKAFSVTNGVETDVSADTVWATSNDSIAIIGATSGNCTGTGAGAATISATANGITATAVMDVLASAGDGSGCCGAEHVGMMLLVDTSRSMSQAFGASYQTRLDFAEAAALRWVNEVNEHKDFVGLITFDAFDDILVDDLTQDKASVAASIPGISQTQQLTSFYDALNSAITSLNASSVDLKVLVLISDGEDTSAGAANGYQGVNNPVQLLSDFKAAGGIVVCMGCRASGRGFAFLSLLSTGRFFLNSYPGIESATLDYFSGLKGYVCAGNCNPAGDVIVNKGKLDYNAFINWTVEGGHVDLIGPGLFDLLPGNGLYVDLAGSSTPAYGTLTSRSTFALTAGDSYRLAVDLAGNQRLDAQPYSVRLRVYYMNGSNQVDLLNQTVVINDYLQPFQTYAFSFVAPAAVNATITIQEVGEPDQTGRPPVDQFFGLLLDNVKFDDTTTLVNLLTDTFNGENPVYVPPACGLGTTFVSGGYVSGYNCYGVGCLDTPPPQQSPDPTALPDIESGFTPPKLYNSTQQRCASCGNGAVNVSMANLVPAMTSATAPSGTASDDSEIAGHEGWRAFSGVSGKFWTASAGMPNWLQYQFLAATVVADYAVSAFGALYPKIWVFQGSNDGSTWTTLDTQTGIVFAAGSYPATQTYRFPTGNTTAFLYYRIYVTAIGPTGIPAITTTVIAGLQMFAVAPVSECDTESAQSTVSQAQADKDAGDAATAAAQAKLVCLPVFTATEQFKASCTNSFGADVTKSATASSYISLAAAQAAALAAAQVAATDALDCEGSNNGQPITINDNTSASPYPSVKFVSGTTGLITNVQVQIKGYTHSYPSDVRMLLRGPDGTTCMLTANTVTSFPFGVSNIDLTFDDSGAALPHNSQITAGTYKPTQYGSGSSMYAPAPAAPYGTTLSVFNGKSANGAWCLFVEDDQQLNFGLISHGFDLVITTA